MATNATRARTKAGDLLRAQRMRAGARRIAPDELEPLRVRERRGARWHVEELEHVVLQVPTGPAIGRRAGHSRAATAPAHRMVRVLLLLAAHESVGTHCVSRLRSGSTVPRRPTAGLLCVGTLYFLGGQIRVFTANPSGLPAGMVRARARPWGAALMLLCAEPRQGCQRAPRRENGQVRAHAPGRDGPPADALLTTSCLSQSSASTFLVVSVIYPTAGHPAPPDRL